MEDMEIKQIIRKIAKLTDHNAHTQAVIELAKMTGNSKLIKIANAVLTIHENTSNGGIPKRIQEYRDTELQNEIMSAIKQKYGDAVADELYSAL